MTSTRAHRSSGTAPDAAVGWRGRIPRRLPAFLLGAFLVVTLFAGLASSASAVIVRLPNGHTISYQPLRGQRQRQAKPLLFDEVLTNLDYNGGPVMPSNTNYTIYWSPAGELAYAPGYITGVNRYLKDLAHDSGNHENVDSVSTQYNDTAGQFAAYNSHFAQSFVDTHAFPAFGCAGSCLTDAQIRSELRRFAEEHSLPMNLETEYFLLLPPKVNTCFEANEAECSAGNAVDPRYCAYHSNIAIGGGGQLIYSNDGYVGEKPALERCTDENFPNGISDTALEGGLSHEHIESITDPEPNSGWTDFGPEPTGEIGDKCRTFEEATEFGTPLGESGGTKWNQVINGDRYWYQQEWSNQGHTCLQRFTLSGAEPTATFSAHADGGLTVTFDASGSTAPGGVAHYVWQFSDRFGEIPRTTETSSPTITHTFPFGSFFNVALTVLAGDGTGIGTSRHIHAGTENPGASFTATPGTAVIGNSIAFDASSSTAPPGTTISEYSWNFGDGSAASGVRASHAYASAGTYEVTLTTTNSDGLSTSVSSHVRVVKPPAAEPPPVFNPAALGLVPLTGTVAVPGAISVKRNGRASARLSCTGTASACSGEVVLTVKRTERVKGHKRTRTLRIGAFRFFVATGHPLSFTFTLAPAGRAMLRAAGGRLKVTATLRRTSPAPALTQSQSLRLSLARH